MVWVTLDVSKVPPAAFRYQADEVSPIVKPTHPPIKLYLPADRDTWCQNNELVYRGP